jgi:hypothetical protein
MKTPIYPGIKPRDWVAWALLDNGIVFAGDGAERRTELKFHDFSRQRISDLAILDKPPFWLTTTPDRKTVIFDQPGQKESHIMLLENVH